jgi:hypothetical protein
MRSCPTLQVTVGQVCILTLSRKHKSLQGRPEAAITRPFSVNGTADSRLPTHARPISFTLPNPPSAKEKVPKKLSNNGAPPIDESLGKPQSTMSSDIGKTARELTNTV